MRFIFDAIAGTGALLILLAAILAWGCVLG
jgi:hypothetical protein